MLKPGDTFRIDPSIDGKGHLWVVLTEPDKDGTAICVCFVTAHEWTDPTTVCEPGEHTFFRNERSAVGYQYAERMSVKRIERNLDGGSFTRHEPCSPALLKKINDGLMASDRTRNEIRQLFSHRD